MMDFFDYIFFRVFMFYKKRDGTPQIYASGVLSILQFFMLLSGLATIRLFIDFQIPQKYFVIFAIVLLIGVNWMRYERNLNLTKFTERWESEEIKTKKVRGWWIVILLVLSISFPILIGVLKHNLGVL